LIKFKKEFIIPKPLEKMIISYDYDKSTK